MTIRLKLSDGTTTVDLFGGTDAAVREGGLNMPAPDFDAIYIGNPEYDGERLARSRFTNRTIQIKTHIWGSSLDDLQTNIRSIQRLLNDARERTLLGHGSQVYLEYQLGTASGESVYFDVLQGKLDMPTNYLSKPLLSYQVLDANLSLECKPLGRYDNQDIAATSIQNEEDGSNHNYQTVSTNATYGDVPAKLYWKIGSASSAGEAKTWLAKRSGVRYDDNLWIQGEDAASTTQLGDDPVTFSSVSDVTYSNDLYEQAQLAVCVGGLASGNAVSRLDYTLSTPPEGHFRVLAYCKTTADTSSSQYARMAWGMGWAYGDRSDTPTAANSEYYSNTADDTAEILDLGDIVIPPIAGSDVASTNALELRIFQYNTASLSGADGYTTPTGASDPSTTWTSEDAAYDDNTSTYAYSANTGGAYSDYLELTLSATICGGARFWVNTTASTVLLEQIDIDAYYDGDWHNVFEGAVASNTWVSKYFSDGVHSVTNFRIRGDPDANAGFTVHELDYIIPNSQHQWDLDYLFLLPIDEGVVVVDSVATTDVIAMDGITDPPNVFILDSNDNIMDTPDYVGKPFTLGREDTRLYVLRSDGKGVTFTSNIKYQPQFLVV